MRIQRQQFFHTLMKYQGIVVLVIGTTILCLLGLLYQANSKEGVILAPSKKIVMTNLPLHEIWRRQGSIDLNTNAPPKIAIRGGLVIFALEEDNTSFSFFSGRYVDRKIIALDIETGELIWTFGPIFSRPMSLDADNQGVYAGYLWHVKALDLKSGEELWTGAKQSQDKHGGFHVYATGNQVDVYDIDSSKFPLNQYLFVLDAQTGETVKTIHWPRLFFHWDDIYYTSILLGGSFGAGLIANDKATDQELWTLHTIDNVRRWPIVIENIMYLDGGDVYAFDAKTGEVYWRYEDLPVLVPGTDHIDKRYENHLVSRIAYADGLLYFLRSDGSVVGLDAKTGQEVGHIEITPSPTYYDEEGIFQDTLNTIVASDKYVAAYYGDSQELIVFERTDVEP